MLTRMLRRLNMSIEYSAPLTRAWERMKSMLFKPFNIDVWLKLGFTAFLAGLLDNGSSGGGGGAKDGFEDFQFSNMINWPHKVWIWFQDHPGWLLFALVMAGVAIALFLVFLWLSSRGKFMLLDNVVNKRANVSAPWKEYKHEANSLFLWRLGFSAIVLLVVLIFLRHTWQRAVIVTKDGYLDNMPILFILQMALFFFLIVLVFMYIKMLLDSFVIPVMYKHRIRASEAWNRFLKIHWDHFGYFIVYGLFILVLSLGIGLLIGVAGLATCCLLFIILAIPYIGSVVLLPVTVTFRAFSIEFLAQFGKDFDLISTAPKKAQK